jgi:SIR2-like domain
MIDPATALAFSLFENKGVYSLLLGSGLSRAAQIPTGWEITLDLIRRAAALKNVVDEPNWAAWHRQQTGKEPNYSDVLDSVSSSPDERRSILHNYIEPTADDTREGRKTPTRAHRAIAWLVREGFIRVILTTNFDRLMENALRELGVEPTVIRSDDDLRGAIPLIHSRCFLLKLHGDYLDTRIKNTDEELGAYSAEFDRLLDRIFDEHGLIVCGWSGEWDHALRAAITRTPSRRFPTYWAARGAIPEKTDDLIKQRAAHVVPIADADSFFTDLQQKIVTQVEMQRPNPRSTELMVATVKRQVSHPELRIQLNDLLAEESRRLAKRLRETFSTQGGGTREEYRSRVSRYEAETELLAHLFGIIGRWGGDVEYGFAAEILADFAHTKIEGGLTWWIDLKFYTTVLLFYAYGLGVLKAGNYDRLFRWFAQSIRREQREAQPLAVRIIDWWAQTNDQWKMLDGLEHNRAPLSEHLHTVTSAWTSDYALTERSHTQHFEMFEILAALAFLTFSATKEEFEEARSRAGGQGVVWSLISRASFDRENRDFILSDLKQPEMRAAMLKAGFSSKDEAHMTLAIESIWRLMAHMQRY